jgi:hypothetical protein
MTLIAEGTRVLLTFRETAVVAEIFSVSPDCRSLVVRFQSTVGPYHGFMQLTWVGDGYADLLEGVYVGLLILVELSRSSCQQTMRLWTHRLLSTARPWMGIRNGEAP